MDSADLVKDAKSVAGFSPCRQFRVEQNAKTALKMAVTEGSQSFKTNFFRFAGTSETETGFGGEKAICRRL